MTCAFWSMPSTCVTFQSPLGDLLFEHGLRGRRRNVVEVEMPPAGALGEPEQLVGRAQVVPVHLVVAGLEELRRALVEDFAHVAVAGVGQPEPLLLVVARGGDEGQGVGVGGPLDVVPAAAAAAGDTSSQSVDRCWSGGILRRTSLALSPSLLRFSTTRSIMVTSFVADQRILEHGERGVTVSDVGEVLFAGLALVLLEGGDAASNRATRRDGVVGVRPAGVVGGVAEVLGTPSVVSCDSLLVAVLRSHRFQSRMNSGFGAVGREHLATVRVAGPIFGVGPGLVERAGNRRSRRRDRR